MIQVVFFASVKEAVGEQQVEVEPEGISRVSDIVARLSENGESWRDALMAENLLVAVNQTMVQSDFAVSDGDEVAFFPPVTGG